MVRNNQNEYLSEVWTYGDKNGFKNVEVLPFEAGVVSVEKFYSMRCKLCDFKELYFTGDIFWWNLGHLAEISQKWKQRENEGNVAAEEDGCEYEEDRINVLDCIRGLK